MADHDAPSADTAAPTRRTRAGRLPLPGALRPSAVRRRRTATVPWIPDVDRSTAVVDCAVYCDGRRETGHPTWQDAIARVQDGDCPDGAFVWIGLHEPSERQLAGIAEALDLHPLAVEDAVHAHQRPKVDRYEECLFAVVKTVHYNDDGAQEVEVVETGEVMVFLGERFVVTVRHGEHGGLHRLRSRLEADREQLAEGPSAVLHAIMDRAVDEYLSVAAELQTDVDEIESTVFGGVNRAAEANRIYLLKREVVEFRRAVLPLSAPLRSLTETGSRFVAEDVRDYFRDVDDHLSQVVEQVSSFDELLTTLVSANLAQVSVMQNEDMRKISAWVAIVSVPTMVAGIYGMNFDHMPELHWRYGYGLVVAVIVIICVGLHRAFKRNGWL